MAHIAKRKGEPILRFVLNNHEKEINLTGLKAKDCQTWLHHVELLISAKILGTAPPVATLNWATALGDKMYKKLVGKLKDGEWTIGLLPPRVAVVAAQVREPMQLLTFCDKYIRKHTGAKKDGTIAVYQQAVDNMLTHFGKTKAIDTITVGDANDFRLWLVKGKDAGGAGLCENTARKRCQVAKQIFADASDHNLCTNPFAKMKGLASLEDRSRDFQVSKELAEQVLAVLPDVQWRAIFALNRYGMLRCPSEVCTLRLNDVDWERDEITVYSPKTEHHDGKSSRTIPIFAELRSYLLDAAEQAEVGQVFVVGKYAKYKNLGSIFHRILRANGLPVWAKPFHNGRASRENELLEVFPIHVVSRWVGHSVEIAAKHYHRVLPEHYARAVGDEKPRPNPVKNPVSMSEHKVT